MIAPARGAYSLATSPPETPKPRNDQSFPAMQCFMVYGVGIHIEPYSALRLSRFRIHGPHLGATRENQYISPELPLRTQPAQRTQLHRRGLLPPRDSHAIY